MTTIINNVETDESTSKFIDENGEYKPGKLNWIKITTVTSIVIAVILIIVSIWGFVFGGFKFLKMKKEAELLYETVYVSNDIDSYKSETKAIWDDGALEILENTNDSLINDEITYSDKSYITEISNKKNNNDCWIAVTDKTRSELDNEEALTSPTIFVHEEIIDGVLHITELEDVYEL